MTHWIYNEFTKLSTAVIFLTQLLVHWEEICEKLSRILGIKKWVQRQLKDRRKSMSFETSAEAVWASIVNVIEGIFKHSAPTIVAAAEAAAAQTAEQQASTDPRLQAGIAAYQAIQNLKTQLATPVVPPTPAIPPQP